MALSVKNNISKINKIVINHGSGSLQQFSFSNQTLQINDKIKFKAASLFRCLPEDPVGRQRRSVQRCPGLSSGVGLLRPLLRQTESCAQTQTPQTCDAHETVLGLSGGTYFNVYSYLFLKF